MRKILLAMALLWLAFATADAAKVNEGKARSMAQEFMQRGMRVSNRAAGLNLQMVWDGESATSRAANAPAFYVYNNTAGKGFVVVAGDDCSKPILMYSFDTNIDMNNLPPNCKAWMEGFRGYINEARANGAQSLGGGVWDKAGTPGTVMKQLETALWGQGVPYNNQTPISTKSGKQAHCVTGCVATATCIVMRYHQYPEKGVGTIPAYTTYTESLTVPARTLGEIYDWSNMPMAYTSGKYTAEQANQVARLMADVGAAVEMEYTTSSSGAVSSDVPGALRKYFGFDKSMQYIQKAYHTEAQWNKKLQDELDNDRVVYYSASDAGGAGGHAFVMDGYTDQDYYHFNWGWEGSSNCYTLLSSVHPEDTKYEFIGRQAAIVNIKPDEGGVEPLPEMRFDSSYDENAGMESSCRTFSKNTLFSITCQYFFNEGDVSMQNLSIALALVNREGVVKEILDSGYVGELPPGYGWSQVMFSELKLTADIEEGDELILAYKMDGLDSWTKVRGSLEMGCVDAIPVLTTDLEKSLAFAYDKASRIITLTTTLDGVSAQLFTYGEDQQELPGVVNQEGKTITVDVSGLMPGTRYTLHVVKGKHTYDVNLTI